MSHSFYDWSRYQALRPLHPVAPSASEQPADSSHQSSAGSDKHSESRTSPSSGNHMANRLPDYQQIHEASQATWPVYYPGLHTMASQTSAMAHSDLAIRFKARTPEPQYVWSSNSAHMHAPRLAPATVSPQALHDAAAFGYSPMHSSISSRSHGSPATPSFDDDMNTLYSPEPMSRAESMQIANTGAWASPYAAQMQDEACQFALSPGSDVDTVRCNATRDSLQVKPEPDTERTSISAFPEVGQDQARYWGSVVVLDEQDVGEDACHNNNQANGKTAMAAKGLAETTDKKTKIACQLCYKTFDRVYNYKQHLHTHDIHRKRPFACDVSGCGHRFYRLTDLKRHNDSKHERSRAYHCEKCHSAFPRKDSLMRHRTTSCVTRVRKISRTSKQPLSVKLELIKDEYTDPSEALRLARANSHGGCKPEQETMRASSYC